MAPTTPDTRGLTLESVAFCSACSGFAEVLLKWPIWTSHLFMAVTPKRQQVVEDKRDMERASDYGFGQSALVYHLHNNILLHHISRNSQDRILDIARYCFTISVLHSLCMSKRLCSDLNETLSQAHRTAEVRPSSLLTRWTLPELQTHIPGKPIGRCRPSPTAKPMAKRGPAPKEAP